MGKGEAFARKIEMNIVDDNPIDPKTGKPLLGITHKAFARDKYHQLVIKNNRPVINGVLKISIYLPNVRNSLANKGLTIRQAIDATAGHEIEHTTQENLDINFHNYQYPFAPKNIERMPEMVGSQIRRESRGINIDLHILKPKEPVPTGRKPVPTLYF